MIRPLSFLLVEDDHDTREILDVVLRSLGHRVNCCEDGLEALGAIENAGPFDAVVMDLQMPRMDGIEATRRLRQVTALADVPIVCVTARVDTATRGAGLLAGCDRIVLKPAPPEAILEALGASLRAYGRLGPGESIE